MKGKERPWVLTKEGPIHATRRINIKALCTFRFPTKKAIKNPAKSSKRTGLGCPEATRGSGSSGCAAQLKWD